jgi:tRNA 2-thiouridine synthesizing protein A
MSNVIDARGLSCPQPVIMTVNEIKKIAQGEITVLVDTDTAKENVSRATNSQGWSVLEINPDEEGYKIRIGN